ncbi:HTH-type transcriptional regulator ImmR [Ligilactobacillus salivarius]|nr:HTH-type transcriptional regulator ImmR [Ligilactobacillus salivarius]
MDRIKELRKEKGLTLKKLSYYTRIPISTLSSYEKGERKPKIDNLTSLANFFDVSVNYLMGIGVSRFDFCDYLISKYYIDYKKEKDTPLFSELSEYVNRGAFKRVVKGYFINSSKGEKVRMPNKIGDIRYIDELMRKIFLSEISLVGDVDFLLELDNEKLKIDNEDTANYVAKELKKKRILDTFTLVDSENEFGVNLDEYLSEIHNIVSEFQLRNYKDSDDKERLLETLDKVIKLTKTYQEKIKENQ